MPKVLEAAGHASRQKNLALAAGFAATVAAFAVIGCVIMASGIDVRRTELLHMKAQRTGAGYLSAVYPPPPAPQGVAKGRAAASHFPTSVVRQMDLDVDPCDDFYEYACGGFEKNVEIPEDLGGFARSWDGGSAKIYAEMRKIFEKDKGKAGDWYRSCMMVDKINEMGAAPIMPYLEQIESIETYDDLWDVISRFQYWDVPAFFDWWVGADNLEPELMNLYFGTGGLILPDYTFYTEGSAEMRSHRAAYREFIVTQLKLTGLSDKEANRDADDCLEIETELAVYQRLEPYVGLKDSFVHLSHDEFIAQNPNINFTKLFAAMHINEVGVDRANIIVKAPEFFHKLNDFFAKRSAKSLRSYLRWHLTYNLSPLLSHEFLAATLKVCLCMLAVSIVVTCVCLAHPPGFRALSSVWRLGITLGVYRILHACFEHELTCSCYTCNTCAAPTHTITGGCEPDGHLKAARALAQVRCRHQKCSPCNRRTVVHRALLLRRRPTGPTLNLPYPSTPPTRNPATPPPRNAAPTSLHPAAACPKH
jgi:hypothetical protein